MLPKEAILEFKALFKKVYGVEISDEEASFRANNLVNLYAAVYSEPLVGRIDRGSEQIINQINHEPTKSNH